VGNHDLEDRIRALGNSGSAPHVALDRIVTQGRVRRGRRRMVGVAAAVIIVAPALTWALSSQGGSSRSSGPATAVSASRSPQQSLMAPECGPRGPILESGSSPTDAPLTQPIRAKAGDQITLWSFTSPLHLSDRPVTSVRFIMAVPGLDGSLKGPTDALKPTNQITAVLVTAPVGRLATQLTIPPGTPPGNYPMFEQYLWPGPSVCGTVNDPNSTMVMQGVLQAGRITVVAR
jgi:hypothetical protein